MKNLTATLLLLAACDTAIYAEPPVTEAGPRYTVDIFVMGPMAGTDLAQEYVAEAEEILGFEIVVHASPGPGVATIVLTDPGTPNGEFRIADDCHRVGWANSAHSLAHELGHFGGLGHIEIEGNLMATPYPGFDVGWWQVETMAKTLGARAARCGLVDGPQSDPA